MEQDRTDGPAGLPTPAKLAIGGLVVAAAVAALDPFEWRRYQLVTHAPAGTIFMDKKTRRYVPEPRAGYPAKAGLLMLNGDGSYGQVPNKSGVTTQWLREVRNPDGSTGYAVEPAATGTPPGWGATPPVPPPAPPDDVAPRIAQLDQRIGWLDAEIEKVNRYAADADDNAKKAEEANLFTVAVQAREGARKFRETAAGYAAEKAGLEQERDRLRRGAR